MTKQSKMEEHRKICEELNIDAQTEEKSWKLFREISKTYSLDHDQLHWMCCSLYTTCRQAVTPTVGNTGSLLQGNCVSLTRLLRSCNMVLYEFFDKINQWVGMASLPEKYRDTVEHLQHSFAVSWSINDKFRKLYADLFTTPALDEHKRSKKSKTQPCTSNQLYEFCWTLFICAKAEYPEQCDDLVTSNSMLLCCLNLIYANAFAEKRRDLLNAKFQAHLSDSFNKTNEPEEPICIIDAISEEGSAPDVKHIMNTYWKDFIEKLFQKQVLRGDQNSFMDLISLTNFDENMRSLNNRYDTFILSCGEIDERILLTRSVVKNESAEVSLCQQTPLSYRNRSSNNERISFTPISTANASVNKLRAKLIGYGGEPQSSLRELFKTCTPDPTGTVKTRLAAIRGTFFAKMRNQNWNDRSTAAKADMIEALYYKLLESIIRAEIKRRPNEAVKLACNEDVNKTLLVCCAEIVIYAHNLEQNFPWILNVFEMTPFQFYRIIEMVVLYHNDILSRDIIKHLKSIEDQCIGSLCWVRSSPLWNIMSDIHYEVPISQNVESSTDLSGITPHKSGDGVAITNGHRKLETSGPRIDLSLTFQSNLGLNSPQRPTTHGFKPLDLFFRKFYALAAIRLRDLCLRLRLVDIQNQIWTIFEHSIVHCTKELMCDRHLDQILMCAIYVLVKVKKLNNTFAEIMKRYLEQPQAKSDIYRSVFIKRRTPEEMEEHRQQQKGNNELSGDRIAPADLAGIFVQHGNDDRGDLILFYNTVYAVEMKDFALKFGSVDEHSLLLSPPPKTPNRSVMLSPKQVDERIPLFVTSMDGIRMDSLRESPNSLTYVIDRSPAKDLEKINRLTGSCKRSLSDPDSYEPAGKRKSNKMDKLISDRREQESNNNAV
ncbi:retinoblastoma-like protein 2 isoform X2 [Malaya genurostris]|uniref:retinoblastoma-like protein 2 isoform X2 n=1 Tax=Malaya genurostris TaxID=325434 RepID=UPI0026F39F0C|nr:retinoblastoma-like protein 2 isoform X2 [Malaya genurostris]